MHVRKPGQFIFTLGGKIFISANCQIILFIISLMVNPGKWDNVGKPGQFYFYPWREDLHIGELSDHTVHNSLMVNPGKWDNVGKPGQLDLQVYGIF